MSKTKKSSATDGLLQRAVEACAALGVPGLVLLVTLELTGLVGAAAFTAALSTLGGPLGMIGGVISLGLILLLSKALARYGFRKVAESVINRLKDNGNSPESIRSKIEQYPQWIITSDVRRKLFEIVSEYEATYAARGFKKG